MVAKEGAGYPMSKIVCSLKQERCLGLKDQELHTASGSRTWQVNGNGPGYHGTGD
jgi:hypothetical protein